jgi:predicted nuclease of predicted toxin-antitoxin system
VKRLFDENLSPRLISLLAVEFPFCAHIETLGMRGTTDASIWDYAKKHGFAIVSKDNDFRQRAFVYGAPPQVIWLSIGNAGTWYIAELLHSRLARMQSCIQDTNDAMLVLKPGWPSSV